MAKIIIDKTRNLGIILIALMIVIINISFVNANIWNSTYNDGLLSYWSFNVDGSDIVGNKNLTEMFSPTHFNSGCKNSGCYNFTGKNYLTNTTPATGAVGYPANNSNVTMNIWWSRGWYPIREFEAGFVYGDTTNKQRFISAYRDNITMFGTYAATLSVTNKSMFDNTWHMLTFTHIDNNTHLAYLDGNAMNTADNIYTTIPNGSIFMGTDGTTNMYNFTGMMDEVSIWSKILSRSEIKTLYNNGAGLFYGLYSSNLITPINYVNVTNPFLMNCTGTSNGTNNLVSLTKYAGIVGSYSQIAMENVSGIYNSSSTYFTGTPGTYNWYCKATYQNGDFFNSNISYFNITSYTIHSLSNTNTTLQTVYETYAINFTIDTQFAGGDLVSSYFNYGSINALVTPTSTKINNLTTYNANISFDIPLTEVGAIKVNWTFTFGTQSYVLGNATQTVYPLKFALCNQTFNMTYINYTFMDESTSAYMNGSLPSNSIDYWLGSGTVRGNILFINLSYNPSYGFCFSPINITTNLSLNYENNVSYAGNGYPQRNSIYSGTITNLSVSVSNYTKYLLYLLPSTAGIYTSIQTASSMGSPITGVNVLVERQIGGLWTQVEQTLTDSSGLATFWVNPNINYRFTASKSGYTVNTVTIKPTQSTYTIIMSSGTSNITYVSAIDGIYYTRRPGSGFVQPGSVLFTYNVTSVKANMANCRFDLTYHNGTVIDTTSSVCTTNAYLTLTHTMLPGETIFGKYYVDMGSGYILIESDGNWRAIATNSSSAGTLVSFLKLLSDRSAWGVNENDSCYRAIYNGNLSCQDYTTKVSCQADSTCFWGMGDDNMRWEFTVIVGLFLILAVFAAATNISFNYDLYNPGYFIWILPILLLCVSLVGQVDSISNPKGLLYIEGATFLPFFDNYIICIYAFIIAGIITLRTQRTQ